MAMSSATLASELAQVVPVDNEPDAIDNLANAYAAYAEDATALTPILAAGVTLGKTAFKTAAVGISAPGQGATKLVAAIQAFWAAVAAGLTTSFAGAVAITPPSAALTPAALQPVFNANTAGNVMTSIALNNIASAIHAQVGGGTVTTAGPIVTPII